MLCHDARTVEIGYLPAASGILIPQFEDLVDIVYTT